MSSFIIITVVFILLTNIFVNCKLNEVFVCCLNANEQARDSCLSNVKKLSKQFDRHNITVNSYESGQVICTDLLVNRKLDYSDIYNGGIIVTGKKSVDLHKYYCIDGCESTNSHAHVNFCASPHTYCQDKLCISQCQFNQDLTSRDFCINGYDENGSTSILQQELQKPDFQQVTKLRNSLIDRQDYGILFHGNQSAFSKINQTWSILANGILLVHNDIRLYNYDEYCIDIKPIHGTRHFARTLYIKSVNRFQLDKFLFFISISCVFVSVGVYIFHPSIRNSHGKDMTALLMLYLISIVFEFCLKFKLPIGDTCFILGHGARYFSLATSFWITLIFFTTCWNIRSTLKLFPHPCSFSKDNKSFYLNIMGIIILTTVYMEIGLIADLVLPSSNYYRPAFSSETCTFETSIGKFYYWSSIKTVLFVINASFLILTNRYYNSLVTKIRGMERGYHSATVEQLGQYDNQLLSNVWLFVTYETAFMTELGATILEVFIESTNIPMPFELSSARILSQTSSYFHASEGILLFALFIWLPTLKKWAGN